jgi:hypothetical protein
MIIYPIVLEEPIAEKNAKNDTRTTIIIHEIKLMLNDTHPNFYLQNRP